MPHARRFRVDQRNGHATDRFVFNRREKCGVFSAEGGFERCGVRDLTVPKLWGQIGFVIHEKVMQVPKVGIALRVTNLDGHD